MAAATTSSVVVAGTPALIMMPPLPVTSTSETMIAPIGFAGELTTVAITPPLPVTLSVARGAYSVPARVRLPLPVSLIAAVEAGSWKSASPL